MTINDIKHAKIKAWVEEVVKMCQPDDVYVNALKVGSSEDPASITFNGEWSLTLTADILRTVENTNTQWAPGEFAFDKTDFAACGLLVAGALLVGLGIYGQRSGIKMGILLLICGGAALIYLTFV